MNNNCVFCDIWRGVGRAEWAYQWDRAFAIVPLNPVTPGHILVIPGLHVRSFTSDPETTGYVMQCASEYANMVAGSYNLITSKGTAATQTVYHLHVHLVPRHEGDGLKLPWSENGSISTEH
jgi:histidine triad (HIT) family protein